jgi:hypothetical protein
VEGPLFSRPSCTKAINFFGKWNSSHLGVFPIASRYRSADTTATRCRSHLVARPLSNEFSLDARQ